MGFSDRIWDMKKIRTMLDEVNEIHLFQSQRVAQAAQQAHLRNRTRSYRAHRKINAAISHQLEERSLA